MLPPVDLQPGENVIYEGHPSWRSILGFYLKGIVGSVVIAAIAAGVTKVADDEVSKGLVGLILALGVAITILVGFIRRISTTYTITDQRLNIKRGIVSRQVQETRLQRVQNVNFNQSAFQRIMQIGDVDFDTAGTDDSDFTFAGVDEPADVVKQVDRASHASAPDTSLGHEPAS